MRSTITSLLMAAALLCGTSPRAAQAHTSPDSVKPAYIPHADTSRRNGAQAPRPLHAATPLDIADDSFLTDHPAHCPGTMRVPLGGADGNHLTSW